ncbi:MAG: helix-turn-helix transcriptional regulator, partial [Geminicoccaceae bacterium]
MTLSRRAGMTPLPCMAIPIGKRSGHQNFYRAPAALLLFGMPPEVGAIEDGPLTRLYGLSQRQAELTALVLEGQSLPQAAKTMQISQNTAKTHLARILDKTGAANLSDLDKLILSGPLGFLERSSTAFERPWRRPYPSG